MIGYVCLLIYLGGVVGTAFAFISAPTRFLRWLEFTSEETTPFLVGGWFLMVIFLWPAFWMLGLIFAVGKHLGEFAHWLIEQLGKWILRRK